MVMDMDVNVDVVVDLAGSAVSR